MSKAGPRLTLHPQPADSRRSASAHWPAARQALRMIDHLDHLVLTTRRRSGLRAFYTEVLGMRLESFVGGTAVDGAPSSSATRRSTCTSTGREFEPKAHLPVPGALDLCFIASVPLDELMTRVRAKGGRSSKAR